MDKGCINSIHQKVMEFFPDYKVKRGEKTLQEVTLYHLLTMTAPYKYKSEPWTKVCTSDNWTTATLDLLGGRSGMSGEFKYSTLGIQILSGVIASASKMSLIDFANENLFKPLEIPYHKNKVASSKEDQMEYLFSKKPKGELWFADPKGVNTAGWGLSLSATDMAKIGQLCLQQGVFNGKQVVSNKWIIEMTTAYRTLGERFGNLSYGYLWWVINEKERIYAALGDGGNIIYVNEYKSLVISIAGTFKPRIFDRIQFIQENIEPLL